MNDIIPPIVRPIVHLHHCENIFIFGWLINFPPTKYQLLQTASEFNYSGKNWVIRPELNVKIWCGPNFGLSQILDLSQILKCLRHFKLSSIWIPSNFELVKMLNFYKFRIIPNMEVTQVLDYLKFWNARVMLNYHKFEIVRQTFHFPKILN